MLESRKAAAPIVRLWLLRLLVPLGGHKEFIADWDCYWWGKDSIIQALGLEHWWVEHYDDAFNFNKKSALKELRKLHEAAEKELKNAKVPDPLANNIKQVKKLAKLSETDYRLFEFLLANNIKQVAMLAKLSETDCRILEFSALLDTEEALACAVDLKPLRHRDVVSVLSALLALPQDEIHSSLAKNSVLTKLGLVNLNWDSRGLDAILELPDEFADRFISADSDSVDLLQGMLSD